MQYLDHWDKTKISPGTKFMDSIYERIVYEIKQGALEADFWCYTENYI